MDNDRDSETVGSDDVNDDKPREEPTGMEEQLDQDEQDSEEKAKDYLQDDSGLDCLAIFAKQLSNQDRVTLFEKGVRFKRKGSTQHALQCLLSCLQGLKERDQFTALPECLHYIAEIYSEQEDYETAIQFAQAEKLYYETALITMNRDEKPEPWDDMPFRRPENTNTEDDSNPSSENFEKVLSDEALKAEEYERLAHLCLKQKNPQLALDYCAKAVKLYQACHGDQHPTTLQTLDLFTLIYAEMGKQQYKAAMAKFSEAQEKEQQPAPPQDKDKNEQGSTDQDTNVNEAKEMADGDESRKQVDVEEENAKDTSIQTSKIPYMDDTVQLAVSSTWAITIYFLLTVFIAIILTAVLCYYTKTDIPSTYNYMTTRMKFYYYYYFVNKPNGGVYF